MRNATKEERADYSAAHAEGLHDEVLRDSCPDCEVVRRQRGRYPAERVVVEVEVRAGDAPGVLSAARKTAERQNPGFEAVASRYTGRRGPHGDRLFEVDLDETPGGRA
jgi:hypothetical protein